MVTDPNPGSFQLSTSSEDKKKKPRKKSKKSKTEKGNGKSKDPEVLLEAIADLQNQLRERDQELEEAQETLEELNTQLSEMREALKQEKARGLGPREVVKLNNLQVFHGRVVNAQMKCDEDKKNLDRLVSDFQYILGKELKPHV